MALMVCSACEKVYKAEESSECINTLIENFKIKKDAISVTRYATSKGNIYYFSDESSYVDSPNYFINNLCDTVCVSCGECIIPECYEDITDSHKENITIIWKK